MLTERDRPGVAIGGEMLNGEYGHSILVLSHTARTMRAGDLHGFPVTEFGVRAGTGGRRRAYESVDH